MNTQKIISLIESLKNELLSLEVYSQSLIVVEDDQRDRKANLALREKKLVLRETIVLDKTKALAEKEKSLSTLSNSLKVKQSKLDGEWNRMLTEREKVGKMSEEVAKDVLKTANERISLTADQAKTKEKDEILARKQKALTELNRKLEIKKANVKAAAKRVDEDSAIE